MEIDTVFSHTRLNDIQIPLIERLWRMIPFATSMTRQYVSVFTVAADEQFLVMGACKRQQAVRLAEDVHLIPSEAMPTWQTVLLQGEPIRSHYAYTEDRLAAIFVFPIVDNGGKVIGGISFVDPRISEVVDPLQYGDAYTLAETLYWMMIVPSQDPAMTYEPISYQDGILIFDDKGIISFASPEAARLVDVLGFDRRLVGASIFGGMLKLSLLQQAMRENRCTTTEEMYGDFIIEQTLLPVGWVHKARRYVLLLKDKTVLRKTEQALLVKNSVIKEIHHRVKNNLQTIAAILRMEARRSDSQAVKAALQEGVHRIESMALVHQVVSHYDEDFISLRTVCEELMRLLTHSLVPRDTHIRFAYEGEDIVVSSTQGGYLSLIMNELFTNSLVHGFLENQQTTGTITVRARTITDGYRIEMQDDGKGLPEDFSIASHKHLGLEIIENLVTNELHGTLCIEPAQPHGTLVRMESIKEETDASGTRR